MVVPVLEQRAFRIGDVTLTAILNVHDQQLCKKYLMNIFISYKVLCIDNEWKLLMNIILVGHNKYGGCLSL